MDDVKRIEQIHFPRRPYDDCRVWLGSEDGVLTVRSAYNRVRRGSISSKGGIVSSIIWKDIWSVMVAPKIILLWWRIACANIPIMSKLVDKHLIIYNRCCVCELPGETIEHSILSYTFYIQVWILVGIDVSGRPSNDVVLWF